LNLNWSHGSRDHWIFSYRQSKGMITAMTSLTSQTGAARLVDRRGQTAALVCNALGAGGARAR
jgi:hypothetical protein